MTVQDKLTGIVLCGPKSALNRVRASDLVVTIDMANNATTGPQPVPGTDYGQEPEGYLGVLRR